MTNRNIDLPSQRALLVNEIEGPLRRRVSQRKCSWILPVLFGLALGATASYFAVAHKVDVQKARADKAIQEDNNFYYSFCEQAYKDHVTTGTKETEALKNLCGDFTK